MSDTVVLTGVKPTGSPHLGNYIGAIRPALASAGSSSFFFIADYHALTTVRDPEVLRELTYEVAATWLACGLDPDKSLFYRQSDIPELFELSWVLACNCPKGWMNKSHAYKALVQVNEAEGRDVDHGVNMGLYTYPILMAADILAFDADQVPVGQDQAQHVEIARDIAQRINHTFGEGTLHLPKAAIQKETAVVPGLDGRKMSKSYGNTLPLFETKKRVRKMINRIATDSTPPDAPKDPDSSMIFQLSQAVFSQSEIADLRARYEAGISWGAAKAVLADRIESMLEEPRERYNELISDKSKIDELLLAGAERARPIAQRTVQRVRDAMGSTAKPLI